MKTVKRDIRANELVTTFFVPETVGLRISRNKNNFLELSFLDHTGIQHSQSPALPRGRPTRPGTAATLWLATGGNPEWAAGQLGHSNTKMLFKVYSKFIPNLTRAGPSCE